MPWPGGCSTPRPREAASSDGAAGQGSGLGCAALVRFQDALGGGRELRQLGLWPHRTAHQLPTAIGTTPARQALVRTGGAERAFERADERVRRCSRQILVATFTVGSELEHRPFLSDD